MFGIEHCRTDLKDEKPFREQLCNGRKYDYIYLGAHANTEFFGDSDGMTTMLWSNLASIFCTTGCLRPGAILLLGCCRGGLKKVATTLFCSCDQIDYVCGPRWTVYPADITAGFHAFLYNMEIRREQPSVAVKRASYATGYDFFCHDRVEMEDELGLLCDDIPECEP